MRLHERLGAPAFGRHVQRPVGVGPQPEEEPAHRERAEDDTQRVVEAAGDVEREQQREWNADERHLDERPHRLGVARRDELPPGPQQHDADRERAERLLDVETLGEMSDGRSDDESDRELPGAPLPPGETA